MGHYFSSAEYSLVLEWDITSPLQSTATVDGYDERTKYNP